MWLEIGQAILHSKPCHEGTAYIKMTLAEHHSKINRSIKNQSIPSSDELNLEMSCTIQLVLHASREYNVVLSFGSTQPLQTQPTLLSITQLNNPRIKRKNVRGKCQYQHGMKTLEMQVYKGCGPKFQGNPLS